MSDYFIYVPSQKPRGKARARTTSQGGRTWSYTPQPTLVEERVVLGAWHKTYLDQKPLKGPLELEITVVRPYPQSLALWKRPNALPTTRPDLDNYVKLVMDALNGHAWEDDSQIISLKARKVYPTAAPGYILDPGYYIEIKEID